MRHNIIATLKSVWGEYGAEALRTTLGAMIPAVLIALRWEINYAVPFVIGALNASMTDFPGHRREKAYIAIWNIICAVSTVLVVGYSLPYPWLSIVLIGILAGLFTLIGALGPRMMMVGVTSLFMIAFVMGLHPANVALFALCVGIGTAWFYVVNLAHSYIDPLWEARRTIRNGYRHTVTLLEVKALCYDPKVPLDTIYQRVAQVSIKLADQHEAIRHLLLRRFQHKRLARKEYRLWLQGYVLMDLYSMATAIDHDYDDIRNRLGSIGVLDDVRRLVLLTARLVDTSGSVGTKNEQDFLATKHEIEHILTGLQGIRQEQPQDVIEILDGTITNARTFQLAIDRLRENEGDELIQRFYSRSMDMGSFLPPMYIGWDSIVSHIRKRTPLFVFAARMALLFFLGGLAGYLLSDMKYTYWILMTIIVVARPSYALTTTRNYERILGTVGGVLLGILFIFLIKNTYILLFFVAFLLFCFLLFNRRIYLISVFFITASVIIALHLNEDSWSDILTSRLIFTLLGSALALLGWFIVPIRNQHRIATLVRQSISENSNFYDAVKAFLGEKNNALQANMRLTRKDAFLAMTKLSDAVIQLHKEPGHSSAEMKRVSELHHKMYHLHAMISNLSMQHSMHDQTQLDNSLQCSRIDNCFDELHVLVSAEK